MTNSLFSFSFNDALDVVVEHLEVLGPMDHFTLAVNLFIFVFSKWFATRYGKIKDQDKSRSRLRILHFANLFLFVTYLVAVIFEISVGQDISQTFLVILASYRRYTSGYPEEIRQGKGHRGIFRTSETHTSRTPELFVCFVILCISIVLLINIWGLGLFRRPAYWASRLFVFASKEYWAGDFLSGILIISQGNIERRRHQDTGRRPRGHRSSGGEL